MPPKLYHVTISADGKLLHGEALSEIRSGETIRVIIDGTQMTGGAKQSTLLGINSNFLTSSHQFTLSKFEPQADGTCLLHYVAV